MNLVENAPLRDLLIITPHRFNDHRGFFSEVWNPKTLAECGVVLPNFVQENHSMSKKTGTLRGLHFQAPPNDQGKLVRCGRGAIFDVSVDIRKGSPTFGQSFGLELSDKNGKQLWIPTGFLHGFVTLQPDSEIIYKCTNHYSPETEGAVHWESCNIDWPIGEISPVVSKKDAAAQPFTEFDSPFSYEAHA